jgi:FkbM family methyltransferase
MLAIQPSVYKVFENIQLEVDSDYPYQWLNVGNYAGFEIVLLLKKLLEPGDVFIDVGANIGYISLNGSRFVGVGGLIIAVEASPETRLQLQRNVALNDARNVKIGAFAASNNHRNVRFLQATDPGFSRLDNNDRDDFGMAIKSIFQVECLPLDEALPSLMDGRTPAVLKIDVEGHELSVLQGFTEHLKRGETIVLYEVNRGCLGKNNVTADEICAFLNGFDYDVFAINGLTGSWFRFGRMPIITRVDPGKEFPVRITEAMAIPRGRRNLLARLTAHGDENESRPKAKAVQLGAGKTWSRS